MCLINLDEKSNVQRGHRTGGWQGAVLKRWDSSDRPLLVDTGAGRLCLKTDQPRLGLSAFPLTRAVGFSTSSGCSSIGLPPVIRGGCFCQYEKMKPFLLVRLRSIHAVSHSQVHRKLWCSRHQRYKDEWHQALASEDLGGSWRRMMWNRKGKSQMLNTTN